MRIVELQFKAFGLFTDAHLDFSEDHRGFQIIYGPNGAGKSSALRGLKGWLYGISHLTTDNFKHDNTRLRVGGRLRHSDGTEIGFLRRKGRKDTLLDFNENPIADPSLSRFLHGVGEEIFAMEFGIDHAALVRGGQEIMEGGGDVGQGLFTAAMGGACVRKLLAELEAEAESLFLSKGQNPTINKAISAHKDARHLINEYSISSRDWSDHQKTLQEAIVDQTEIIKQLKQQNGEKNRLSRLLAIKPNITKRNDLMKQLHDLGNVVLLPNDFGTKRREASQKLEVAKERRQSIHSELERLMAEVQTLEIPEPILHQMDTITELQKRLGAYQKAGHDLPKLQATQRQLKHDAEAMLTETNLSPDAARKLRPTASLKARLQELGGRYPTLISDGKRAKKDFQTIEKQLMEATETMNLLECPRDAGPLRRTLVSIQKEGNLEEQEMFIKLRGEEEKVQVAFSRLGQWMGTIEELARTPLPASETCDRFESDFQKLEGEQTGLKKRLDQVQAETRDIDRDIEKLRLAGDVPTENDLEKTRARRDRGWGLIRRDWLNQEDVEKEIKEFDSENPLPAAYEKAVHQADEWADRLRREADRVASQAELISRRAALIRERDPLMAAQTGVWDQIQQCQREWLAVWQSIKVRPLSPKEMRLWLGKINDFLQKVEQVDEKRKDVTRLDDQVARYRAELSTCLTRLNEAGAERDETLTALLERSQIVVGAIDASHQQRKNLDKAISKLHSDIKEAKEAEREAAQQVIEWQSEWSTVVQSLGLTNKALPVEANAVLGRLEEMFKNLDEVDKIERMHISPIGRDAKQFREDVQGLVVRIAPDLVNVPPEQIVADLNARLTKAQTDSVRQSELRKQIKEREKTVQQAQVTINLMTEQLETLCQQVGCAEPYELEPIEQRSIMAQNLREHISRVEEQLAAESGGGAIEVFIQEADMLNADTLPAEISEIVRKIAALEEQRSETDQRIGTEQTVLKQMDSGTKVADAAEKAQSILASLRNDVEQYIRLRLAVVILRREIERYRAENQGPLLPRASDIFSRLTVGKFAKLQADFNETDDRIFMGIRSNGDKVRIEVMSEGERDQLYLSLRLATMEQYLKTNEPIPFIVDDILIQFDNDRAAATLEVLADLSTKTQVIFFTHHAHLVDLAKTIRNSETITIHRLI